MKNIDKSNISLRLAYIFESILAMVVLIAVFLGTIDVLRMIWTAYIVEYHTPVAYSQLNDILAQTLLLVIAIEFVVMLSLHIPGTIIEVIVPVSKSAHTSCTKPKPFSIFYINHFFMLKIHSLLSHASSLYINSTI